MNFDHAANFIWQHGRLLERRILEYFFFNGSKDYILKALKAYQNDDGGFGNAIEPDLRAPNSQPLFMEFGLRVLYDCRIKDKEISNKACDFIANHADLNMGIPAIFPSSINYPKAEHWNLPFSTKPSFSRLTGLVGLLKWQGIEHSWLEEAAEICLKDIFSKTYDDAHTILTAFCLIESMPQSDYIKGLFHKLSKELYTAKFFRLDVETQGYGLTPLEFASTSSSYCRSIFSDEIISKHLDVLESQQDDDGGWLIDWKPPGDTAKFEWRAYKTLKSIMTLKSYGKI
ncbi:hypothetical protein COLU111180_07160 [Cohnella lubricantis]|uniref:Prenyltransferase n=1 Tax=Cohnella lubricantis TaxID=2163172 RepID=A0A841TC38_9BACL|nr:hypothetical protein [Cohnella lubricantis]MBB6678572.1 hypothetical protein [Cohnella lubricantis]MBP2119119.1 hypothetical protein [Cohnella lubricantis]